MYHHHHCSANESNGDSSHGGEGLSVRRIRSFAPTDLATTISHKRHEQSR